jgi:hypothetical protein
MDTETVLVVANVIEEKDAQIQSLKAELSEARESKSEDAMEIQLKSIEIIELKADVEELKVENTRLEQRIEMALGLIHSNGATDGAHHKQWVLDQAVRYLTGCPLVEKHAKDCNGNDYAYEGQGESEEYREWVKAHNGWDTGIAP